ETGAAPECEGGVAGEGSVGRSWHPEVTPASAEGASRSDPVGDGMTGEPNRPDSAKHLSTSIGRAECEARNKRRESHTERAMSKVYGNPRGVSSFFRRARGSPSTRRRRGRAVK